MIISAFSLVEGFHCNKAPFALFDWCLLRPPYSFLLRGLGRGVCVNFCAGRLETRAL